MAYPIACPQPSTHLFIMHHTKIAMLPYGDDMATKQHYGKCSIKYRFAQQGISICEIS